jgi:L-gulonolactone oxidase
LHVDVIDELEQMALYKYGALPHWGKSRNYAFNETKGKYPRARQVLGHEGQVRPGRRLL